MEESDIIQLDGNRSRPDLKVRVSVGVNIISEQRLGGGNNRGRVDPITLRLFSVLKGPVILLYMRTGGFWLLLSGLRDKLLKYIGYFVAKFVGFSNLHFSDHTTGSG